MHMHNFVEKENMSKEPRRLLVGGLKAEKILLATPLLKWYLERGLVVTKIHRVIECTPNACFKQFTQTVSNARRQGDANPDMAIITDTMKLLGNSGYSSLLLDKERHRDICYVLGERQMKLKVNDPRFRHLTSLDDEMFKI